MEKYNRLKKEHLKLFLLYHQWYNDAHNKNIDSRRIYRTLSTKYTSFRRASNNTARKRALYTELRRLGHQRRLAWRHYYQRLRFNIFRLVFFSQTKRCPEFCRQLVEQYL